MDYVTTSVTPRYSPQYTATKARVACEACHQRKIRCQMIANRSICQACDAGGRECFFVPRAKAGRPRLTRNRPFEGGVLSSGSSMRSEEYENRPDRRSRDKMPLADFSLDHDWTEFSKAKAQDFFTGDYSPILAPFDNSFRSNSSGQDHATISHMSSTMLRAETPSTGSSDIQTSPDAFIASPILAEFSTVLHTCTELQKMHQNVAALWDPSGDPIPVSGIELQSILQNLDAAGEALVNAVERKPSSSGETIVGVSALVTLIMASIFKMLEICRSLIQNRTQRVQTLSQVQLLKRVDFNIMQARTALRQLVQSHVSPHNVTMEISSLASQLQHEIKTGLENLPAELGG